MCLGWKFQKNSVKLKRNLATNELFERQKVLMVTRPYPKHTLISIRTFMGHFFSLFGGYCWLEESQFDGNRSECMCIVMGHKNRKLIKCLWWSVCRRMKEQIKWARIYFLFITKNFFEAIKKSHSSFVRNFSIVAIFPVSCVSHHLGSAVRQGSKNIYRIFSGINFLV